MNLATKEQIEYRLETGLLGQWYVVGKSVQVQLGKPYGVKALGRHLVLWRDVAGKLQCVEDYCPHRGARLSRGEIHDGLIACRYHGVTLDGTGTVLRVPAMPGCALEGRKAVDAYEVLEANDAVFVFFRPLKSLRRHRSRCRRNFPIQAGQAFFAWENGTAATYSCTTISPIPCTPVTCTRTSFTLAFGAKQDVMKLEERPDGFYIAKVAQQDVNLDWTHMVMDGDQVYCRLDIPYPAAMGPGGPFRIIGYATPIDENSCMTFFWRFRQVQQTARESWRNSCTGQRKSSATGSCWNRIAKCSRTFRLTRISVKCSINMMWV